MRRLLRLLVTATALTVAAANIAALAPPSADAGVAGKDLPPSEFAALRRLFRKQVAPFDLTISRALLQDIDTYKRDSKGTHLALYVEPVSADYTDAQYIENFTRLTQEFIPAVFTRWKDLESFDICQEPASDPRKSPPSVTQIYVDRASLDRVDNWRRAELTELLAASPRTRSTGAGYYAYFAPFVTDDPTFVAAAQAAGWPIPAADDGTS